MRDLPEMTVSILLEKAAREIAAGSLPAVTGGRIWGGPGSGKPCGLCGRIINSRDVELEPDTGEGEPARFHPVCHSLWARACARLGRVGG
jgi:hypothetical protein